MEKEFKEHNYNWLWLIVYGVFLLVCAISTHNNMENGFALLIALIVAGMLFALIMFFGAQKEFKVNGKIYQREFLKEEQVQVVKKWKEVKE